MGELKVCSQCEEEKEVSHYAWRNRKHKSLGRENECAACRRTASRSFRNSRAHTPNSRVQVDKKRYLKRKEAGDFILDWLKEQYEGLPCPDCDTVYPWCVMDFDHEPTEEKSFNIGEFSSNARNKTNISRVKKEIEKGTFVCANCHRIRTWITIN